MTSKLLAENPPTNSLSVNSSIASSLFWRRRQNCCSNFYAILYKRLLRKSRHRKAKLIATSRLTQSVGGDFVYSNAYEQLFPSQRNSPTMCEKTSTDLYLLESESLGLTPPPLPLRNFSSVTPQPRPDIGRCSTEPPLTTPSHSPTRDSTPSSVISKYRRTVFSNNHFEPLLEEDTAQQQVESQRNSSCEETVSVQIHRDTSATPISRNFVRPASKMSQISNNDHLFQSRPASKISQILPIFEDRRSSSKLSGAISINSRLFDDNCVRTSNNEQGSESESEFRTSALDEIRSNVTSPVRTDVDKHEVVQPSDIEDSIILETDHYVQQIKERRNQLMSKIDVKPSDRWRRKVGYEIERRLVKAIQARTFRKNKKKFGKRRTTFARGTKEDPGSTPNWLHALLSSATYDSKTSSSMHRSRRRRLKRHHFCLKCITSSFRALFVYLGRPVYLVRTSKDISENLTYFGAAPGAVGRGPDHKEDLPAAQSFALESRTPTPKMLLNAKDGTLHWPVYQVGGAPGSGMLISTSSMLQYRKTKPDGSTHQPGRENFLLGEQMSTSLTPKGRAEYGEDDKKLIGWLRVRDERQKKKSFLQVVNPAPEGPFRKAPWHGNIHVLKF